METETAIAESDGAQLNQVLDCHRKFLENVYALVRFLEAEVTKRNWDLVRNIGYAITRNGTGNGLASFATADWFPTHAGIAFVRTGLTTVAAGTTNTRIPPDGLQLLYFQVRWLDKSPVEPVVWYGNLLVKPDGSKEVKKWEEYQSQAFRKLEAEPGSSEARTIHSFKVGPSGAAVTISGDYTAVPLTNLLNEQDVVSRLVSPALAE